MIRLSIPNRRERHWGWTIFYALSVALSLTNLTLGSLTLY